MLGRRPSAHCAMVLSQVIFGAGTVLVGGDMKKHPIDPVVFALIREVAHSPARSFQGEAHQSITVALSSCS